MIYQSNEYLLTTEPTYAAIPELSKYLPVCAGFDIETTNYHHKGYMYHWQLSLNDDVILGRTWEQFQEVYNHIVELYHPTANKPLLIWIHNASFEFSFIKKRFKWNIDKDGLPNIFALNKRSVVYAITREYIEFRDSAVLTGMSLAKLAKTYCTTQKMKGDLDYKIMRNSRTPLTDKELQYCINDVVILSEFAIFAFSRYGDRIALTKTGIVRNQLKEVFKAMPKAYKQQYRRLINKAFPSHEEYQTWFRWVYRGGWVHANFEVVDEDIILDDGHSFDFKSSYPARMLTYKFCYKYISCKPSMESIMWVLNDIDNRGFITKIHVTNLRRKTCHSVFSLHKTQLEPDAIYTTDNGRITYASSCTLYLTEWDWLDLENFYLWDDIEILELKYGIKDYLPSFLRDLVYKLFITKETQPKDTIDYTLAKQDLNATYGMCVTSILQSDLFYDEESGTFLDGDQLDYNKALFSQILLPQWGIQISAMARNALLTVVARITAVALPGETSSALYGDTDSIKLNNTYRYRYLIDEYNEEQLRRNQTVKDLFGYDLGKLGCFEDEGPITRFKTLGCKRYLYTTPDGTNHLVVAGMPKHALDEAMKCPKFDIYKSFSNNLTLPSYASGKLTTYYNDEPHEDIIDGELMRELSSVSLYEIPFTMSMEEDFVALVQSIKDKKKLWRVRG